MAERYQRAESYLNKNSIPYRAELDVARPCEASDIRDARKGMV